ncbi:MAG: acyltransferase family protein [Bacteroidales bacterium]
MDKKDRFEALDILRGLTIVFMIIANNPGSWSHVYDPLRHAEWHGFTPTDLIFPMFLFIVGASCFFAFRKFNNSLSALSFRKVLIRTLLIFGTGLFLNYFPFFDRHLEELRFMGVLQRIALAYFFASILVLLLKNNIRIIVAVFVILMGYWAVLYFGASVQPYSLEHNIVRHIDLHILGASHLYKGYGIPFDPEGLLSTLPAIATVLIGYLSAGHISNNYRQNKEMTVARCFVLGGGLIVLAHIWSFVLPINKPIWTSSYVVYAGGWSLMIFAIVLWGAEKKNSAVRALDIFKTVGYNPLVIFVLSSLLSKLMTLIHVGIIPLQSYLYTDIFSRLGDKLGSLTYALAYTSIFIFLAYLMKRKNLIFRL